MNFQLMIFMKVKIIFIIKINKFLKQVIGLMEKDMVKVYIDGIMEKYIMENGNKIKWM